MRGSSPKLETLTLLFLMAHISHLPTDLAAWMGEEFGGQWIPVYVWLCPFAMHLNYHNIADWLYSDIE